MRRLAVIVIVVMSSMCAARAADLGDAWSGGGEVYCGSDMITIYDSQPGVATRRWKTNCKTCDRASGPKGFRRAAAPIAFPPYPPFMEPWRR